MLLHGLKIRGLGKSLHHDFLFVEFVSHNFSHQFDYILGPIAINLYLLIQGALSHTPIPTSRGIVPKKVMKVLPFYTLLDLILDPKIFDSSKFCIGPDAQKEAFLNSELDLIKFVTEEF